MKNGHADVMQIINEFKFKKVHKAMTALKWKWSSSESVPSISEMKNVAMDLLSTVTEKSPMSGTGGFVALLEDGKLKLSFVLEEVVND